MSTESSRFTVATIPGTAGLEAHQLLRCSSDAVCGAQTTLPGQTSRGRRTRRTTEQTRARRESEIDALRKEIRPVPAKPICANQRGVLTGYLAVDASIQVAVIGAIVSFVVAIIPSLSSFVLQCAKLKQDLRAELMAELELRQLLYAQNDIYDHFS
ncbi:hypothetical protein HQQ80_02250 [Microbacteriaceae bacterium VKM Ac-2855]|nr:hypothetical protein [Microbacteriaceae bacterium VKM Ac-2855]